VCDGGEIVYDGFVFGEIELPLAGSALSAVDEFSSSGFYHFCWVEIPL